nr:hypothetical protein CFP56_68592 [Quercus suber]
MRHSTVRSSCKLAVPRAPSILVTSFWIVLNQDENFEEILGRINEICGQEASGKTNVALHIIKEAQIKSVEIFCSRMQDQAAISHCLMMLCHGSSSCYLFVLAVWFF